MREREKRALDDLTKLMINGDTQHASQSNDVFHFLVFSFSVLDNVLYNRCYGYSIVCQKQKPNAHFFSYPIVCCHVGLSSLLTRGVGPQLTSHMKGETNALKLPNKFDKKKLIQCKCLVRDNEFVISQSFRR